jgi:4'-phosphopantetheinyl transferase
MIAIPPWCPPPDRLALEPDSLHLWRVRLDESCARSDLFRILSPDEKARAQRLRIPSKANAFIVGRARLRQILARYLDRPPAELTFTRGPQGKPALAACHGGELHFNLAHSGAWMLLAVTSVGPVGVDLERIDPALDFAPLVRRYFSSAEQEVLNHASPARQRRTFYRLWTGKEAFLKGRGEGFAGASQDGAAAAGRCACHLFVARGYVAALALPESRGSAVRRLTWEGE